MNHLSKQYLGDSLFVQEEDGALLLTTENAKDSDGNPIIGNAIYLEPETLCNLQRFLINRKVTQTP
jgi:hypothetical protein